MSENESRVVVGRHPVLEELRQRGASVEKVLFQRGVQGEVIGEIRSAAHERGVPVQYVPSQRIDQLADGVNHQGVVARTAPVAYVDVDEMLSGLAPTHEDVRARRPLVLVLDRVTDPQNFGAILRTAVASGVGGVIVPSSHMAPLSAATVKASAGMAGYAPVARVSDLEQVLYQMKERGYWIAGLAAGGTSSVWEMDWDRPLALVVGSEGEGIRRSVLTECDFTVSIPVREPAESLNVSVAAAVALFQAARVRTASGDDAPDDGEPETSSEEGGGEEAAG